jgi:hypothetical protein
MKMKQTLLVASAMSALVLSARPAQAQSFQTLIVTRPAGSVRIQQALPCGDDLNFARAVAGGRVELIPSRVREELQFTLGRLELFLEPFAVRRTCSGIEATASFSEIGVRLASAVTFPVTPVETGDAGQYRFTIPKEAFLIYESVVDNSGAPQPERAFQRPTEDVSGLIDVGNRRIEIHVVLATRLHFRAGCVGDRCVIDVVKDGTQTADVTGVIIPPTLDQDGDRIPDLVDNCPLTANPTQAPVATPVLTPPPDVTLHSCLSREIGRATATDVCQVRGVQVTNNAPAKFAPGVNLVTWFGNNGVNPIVSAVQRVTVQDTTAPTVSCTVFGSTVPGRFQVAGSDDCERVGLALGSYRLANGEVIQIELTRLPGVRLLGTDANGIRHFAVGPGQAVIAATDAAGNVANAACVR